MNHCLPAMDRVLSSSTHVQQLGVERVAPGEQWCRADISHFSKKGCGNEQFFHIRFMHTTCKCFMKQRVGINSSK